MEVRFEAISIESCHEQVHLGHSEYAINFEIIFIDQSDTKPSIFVVHTYRVLGELGLFPFGGSSNHRGANRKKFMHT